MVRVIQQILGTRFPGADGCTADQVLNLTVTPKPTKVSILQICLVKKL
jgi:hypothetical protein